MSVFCASAAGVDFTFWRRDDAREVGALVCDACDACDARDDDEDDDEERDEERSAAVRKA